MEIKINTYVSVKAIEIKTSASNKVTIVALSCLWSHVQQDNSAVRVSQVTALSLGVTAERTHV